MNTAINIQGTGPDTIQAENMARLIDVIFSGAHAARMSDEVVLKALDVLGQVFGGVSNTNISDVRINMTTDHEARS